MSAIDETWCAATDRLVITEKPKKFYKDTVLSIFGTDAEANDRAKLAACAPEALRMLMDLMDGMGPHNPWSCCYCGIEVNGWTIPQQKHLDECPWFLLMKKAGLR